MRFKIDWASHIVGSKFTVFALLYFVFEGNFPSTSPRGAYIWRGLFSEFYGNISIILNLLTNRNIALVYSVLNVVHGQVQKS